MRQHLNAGTGVDYRQSFDMSNPLAFCFSGYASSKSSKEVQNEAPRGWVNDKGSVGRYWGRVGLDSVLTSWPPPAHRNRPDRQRPPRPRPIRPPTQGQPVSNRRSSPPPPPQPLNRRRHRPTLAGPALALYSIGWYDPDGDEIEPSSTSTTPPPTKPSSTSSTS